MTVTWEARMAARARERKVDHEAVERRLWERRQALVERQELARRASMTLGQGMELLNAPPGACACVGPPFCCLSAFIQARALQRGAHIIAKLLTDSVQDHAD